MTSYHVNIPGPNDDPSFSQADLLDNTNTINSRWQVNHVPLTQSTNPGYHKSIFFEAPLVADPNLVTPLSSLYTKTDATTLMSELFFQNDTNATDVVQLTGLTATASGTQFYLVTPWRLGIQMGTATGAGTINFGNTFPAGVTILTALATGINCSNVRITAAGQTSFTYTATGGTDIYYFILGAL